MPGGNQTAGIDLPHLFERCIKIFAHSLGKELLCCIYSWWGFGSTAFRQLNIRTNTPRSVLFKNKAPSSTMPHHPPCLLNALFTYSSDCGNNKSKVDDEYNRRETVARLVTGSQGYYCLSLQVLGSRRNTNKELPFSTHAAPVSVFFIRCTHN